MLAYRHAFHAGNHADVLKHLVLAQVLLYMVAKDKPVSFIDTHAGAGGYSLESRYAQKNAEAATGIERLWARSDLPPAVAHYVSLVGEFNGGGALEQVPGSPAIANLLLRPTDPLHAYELHPTDEKILRAYLAPRQNAKVALADGFAALPNELPPPSRRGVVLMDPSYEMKTDYARTVAAVREALQRFATGVVLVWAPQVALVDARELPRRLMNAAATAPKGVLHARLTVAPPQAWGYGMTGSSMLVINPPHGLAETLREVLPYLRDALAQFDGASFSLDVK